MNIQGEIGQGKVVAQEEVPAIDRQEISAEPSKHNELSIDDYESVAYLYASLDTQISKLQDADTRGDKEAVSERVVLAVALIETLKAVTKYDESMAWEHLGEAVDKYGLDLDDVLEQVDALLATLNDASRMAD